MGSKSQAMLNKALFEAQDQEAAAHSQMGFFSFPPNLSFQVPSMGFNHRATSQLFEAPFSSNILSETLLSNSVVPLKNRDDDPASVFGGQELLSLQRSLWPWGQVAGESLSGKRNVGSGNDYHLGVSATKMKKMKGRRKVREPRFSFKTMSDVDVLDDGYKWRKYGQKVVKNTQHPRSYYRCTQDHCRVKKRVERLAEDPRMVITTYEGRHIHSPSHDSEDSEAQTHLNNFFW